AALEAIFKERFLGAYLVGVALHPTRHDRGRRPEVVAIVTDASAADVAALGEEAKSAMRAGIRIQLVSEWDLSRSADAFALQVADWKCHHAVLAGDDSRLAQVLVKREHVRLAAERRLREMQRRLRQLLLETHLVAGAPKTEVPEVAAQALDDLLVLARHVLPLLGEDAPEDEAARLAAVVDAAGGDTELLATAYARLHDGDRIPRPIALLDAFLPIFAALTDRVDALE
ncbi:MAG: hypothetical protein AAGH15_28800, partial [Myxococcota bacterium]